MTDQKTLSGRRFRVIAIIITSAALVSCSSATLTGEGAAIVAMSQSESAGMLGACERLGTVQADSDSVFGGVIGRPQAIANAKNKAAEIRGADTLVYTNYWEDFSGSHVNGVVYRCAGTSQPAALSTASFDSPREESSASKYDDLQKLEQLRSSGTLTQEEFEVEKKKVLAR